VSPRIPLWLLVAVVVTVGVACGEIAGLDTFIRGQGQGGGSTSSSGTTSTSSGTGGSASSSGLTGGGGTYVSECPEGTVEAPDVPAGWQGHFKIVLGSTEAGLPSCGSVTEVTLHGQLSATPATCGCSCGAPLKNDCTTTLARYAQSDTGCTGTPQATATLSYGCNQLNSTTQLPFSHQPDAAPPGICSASAQSPVTDPATWGNHLRGCEAPVVTVDDLGCTEAPLPPFDDRLCVVRTGEHSCPVDFPFGEVLYGSYLDARGCADDCVCFPGSVQCSGVLRVFGGAAACSYPNPGTYSPGCAGTYISSEPEAYYEATVSGSCSPGAATPTGEAVGAEPATVCCAQP